MKSSKTIVTLFVFSVGVIISSFTTRTTLGEMVWFSDEVATGYAFFDYGTVSYMQNSYGFTTWGTPAERELIGYSTEREDEAFMVLHEGLGGRVYDAILIDFPYFPDPNEMLYYCY